MEGLVKPNNKAINVSGTGTHSALYFGMNGFGISWVYFAIHMVLFFIACTGVMLNSLAIFALRGRTTTATVDISRIFILNLACSDMITDLTAIYTVLYNLIHYKNYYECAFRNGLVTCMNLNSALHLLSLTFDRYYKIAFPYKYVHVFQEYSAKRYCACVWIFCLVLSVLPVLGWREQSLHGLNYCSYFGVMSHAYLFFIALLFILAFLFMVFCYVIIWLVAVKQGRLVGGVTSSPKGGSSSLRVDVGLWWRPTRTVLTLVLFYALCWMPFGVVAFLHLTDGFSAGVTNDQKGVLAAYSSFFVFLNTIGNPVIYVKRIKAVRLRIIAMFLSPYGKLYERYVASKRHMHVVEPVLRPKVTRTNTQVAPVLGQTIAPTNTLLASVVGQTVAPTSTLVVSVLGQNIAHKNGLGAPVLEQNIALTELHVVPVMEKKCDSMASGRNGVLAKSEPEET